MTFLARRLWPLALLAFAACGSDDDTPSIDAHYAVGTLVFGTDSTTTTYVNLLETLEPQTLTFDRAIELPGLADLWVLDGAVYIASSESKTITRYTVDGDELVETGKVSFVPYGLIDFGFWRNAFASPTKAYMLNGVAQYVIWNPQTMEITGTLDVPALADRDGLTAYPGYSDRAAVLRDGKLYQPLYWTDDSFFRYTSDSRIAVIDTATDTVEAMLEAPCPGLDHASVDATGDVYVSSWVYAPGGAVVLDQPATCVVRIDTAGAVTKAFEVPAVADGRQGGALRFLGDGRALLSVLHDERATFDDTTDPGDVAFANNWKFWSYDVDAGTAAPIEGIDWNAGAEYTYSIDGTPWMLVSKLDYSATTIYDMSSFDAPQPAIEVPGWSVRLFEL